MHMPNGNTTSGIDWPLCSDNSAELRNQLLGRLPQRRDSDKDEVCACPTLNRSIQLTWS